jgi:hypothetical protein
MVALIAYGFKILIKGLPLNNIGIISESCAIFAVNQITEMNTIIEENVFP